MATVGEYKAEIKLTPLPATVSYRVEVDAYYFGSVEDSVNTLKAFNHVYDWNLAATGVIEDHTLRITDNAVELDPVELLYWSGAANPTLTPITTPAKVTLTQYDAVNGGQGVGSILDTEVLYLPNPGSGQYHNFEATTSSARFSSPITKAGAGIEIQQDGNFAKLVATGTAPTASDGVRVVSNVIQLDIGGLTNVIPATPSLDSLVYWDQDLDSHKRITIDQMPLTQFSDTGFTVNAEAVNAGIFPAGTWVFPSSSTIQVGSTSGDTPNIQFWDRDSSPGGYLDVISVPSALNLDIGSAGWAVDILGSSVLVNGAAIGTVSLVQNATNGGLTVTNGSGPTVDLEINVDDLLAHSGTLAAADRFAVHESGAGTRKIAASSIGLNSFNNNLTLTAADIADGQFATVSGTYTFAGAPVLRMGSNTLQPTLQFWDRDTLSGSYRDVITVPDVEELDIGSAGWAVDILGSSVLVNGAAIGTVSLVQNATNGGLTVTNGTTTPTLAVDASNLPNFTASDSMEATDRFVVHEAGQGSPTARQIAPIDIPLSIFNDNLGFSQNVQGDGISLTTTTGTNDTISVAYAASATNLIGAAQLLVGNAATTDRILVTEGGASAVVRQAQVSQLPFTNNTGDITRVNITAGNGLSGTTVDTTSGDHTQTLTVGVGDGITVSATAVGLNIDGLDDVTLETAPDDKLLGADQLVFSRGSGLFKSQANDIPLGSFLNDQNWTANAIEDSGVGTNEYTSTTQRLGIKYDGTTNFINARRTLSETGGADLTKDLVGTAISGSDYILYHDFDDAAGGVKVGEVSDLPFLASGDAVETLVSVTNGGISVGGTATDVTLDLNIVDLSLTATSPTGLDSLPFHLDGGDSRRILFEDINLGAFNDDLGYTTVTASLGAQRVVNDIRINYGSGANGLIGAAPNTGVIPVGLDALLIGDGGLTSAVESIQFSDIPLSIMNTGNFIESNVDETITGAYTFTDQDGIFVNVGAGGLSLQNSGFHAASILTAGLKYVPGGGTDNSPYDRLNWEYTDTAGGSNTAGSAVIMKGNGTETGLTVEWYTAPTSTGIGANPASLTKRFDMTTAALEYGTAAQFRVTSAGLITAGEWDATTIAVAHGGTGISGGIAADQFLIGDGAANPYVASGTSLTWTGSILTIDNATIQHTGTGGFTGDGSGLSGVSADSSTVTDLTTETATYYPIMADGTSGAISHFVDASEFSYTATTDTLNVVSLAASSDVTLGTNADLVFSGGSTSVLIHTNQSTRDKIRVWSTSFYAIGMQNSFTFGPLGTNYAMTFQMNDDANRGFWWGHDNHTQSGGAMALSTDGYLTLARHMRLGYGEADTTAPTSTRVLDISMASGATTAIDINGLTTGDYILDWGGTGHTRMTKITDEGGFSIGCDSSMVILAGDTTDAYVTGRSIVSTTTLENLHLASDGNVYIAPNQQLAYTTAQQWVFTTVGQVRPYYDGTNLTPTYAFGNDQDTGMRLAATGTLRLSAGSDDVFIDVDAPNNYIFMNRHAFISEARDELIRMRQTSATGNPYLSWYQVNNRRMYISYNDNGRSYLVNENSGAFEVQTAADEILTLRVSNTTGKPYITLANQDGAKAYWQGEDDGTTYLGTALADAPIHIRDFGRSFNMATFDYNGTDTVTFNSNSDAVLALNTSSGTGQPLVRFKQNGTDKARVQYINGGQMRFRLEGNTDDFSFYAGGAVVATDRRLNFNGLGNDLGRWGVENSQFYVEEYQTVLTVAATVTCDWDRSNQLHLTITNTVTIIAIDDDSMQPGGSYILMVQEGTSAPSSVTWSSTDTIFWANGTAPVLNAGDLNDITVVQFFKTTAGSNTRIIGSWFLAQ